MDFVHDPVNESFDFGTIAPDEESLFLFVCSLPCLDSLALFFFVLFLFVAAAATFAFIMTMQSKNIVYLKYVKMVMAIPQLYQNK